MLPGFIDAHSHIGLFESGTRETEHNERTNSITPHMRAIDGINPADIAFMKPEVRGLQPVSRVPEVLILSVYICCR